MTHTAAINAAIPPDIAKLLDDHANASLFSSVHGDPMGRDKARAALEHAYASHTEPGLRCSLEIMNNEGLDAICEVIGAPKLYNEGKSAMRSWFIARARAELDKLADDPIPEEWKSTPPATQSRSGDIAKLVVAAERYMLAVKRLGESSGYNGLTFFEAPISKMPNDELGLEAVRRWRDLNDTGRALTQTCRSAAAPSGNHPVGVDEVSAIERIKQRLSIWAASKPEDDETWESWFAAAFDLFGAEIHKIRNGLPDLATRPAPSVATVTDEMIDRAFGAQPNVFGRYISDEDRRIMRLSIEAALGHTAPTGEERA